MPACRDFALYYIGGIIKHARALNAITNPGTNSYKRLVPGFEAPVKLAYSAKNRSASIRIPFVANPKGRRVEARFPDPLMNPYLGFAALLMAGLDGVENKIHPGEAASKDLYHLPPEEDALIPTVCHSLDQALEYLDKDRAFLTKGGVFTDAYIDAYIDLKMQEVTRFRMATAPGRVRHVLLAVSSTCSASSVKKGTACGRPFSFGGNLREGAGFELHENAGFAAHYTHDHEDSSPFSCWPLSLAAGVPIQAQAQERVWRCGNEYTNNAADSAEARLQGDGGRQRHRRAGHPPDRGGVAGGRGGARCGRRPAARASTAPTSARATARRARCSRPSCKKAEARQAELLKEYNNGEPEKQGSESRNYQKYLDRVAEMKAEIARNESDIAGIRRELRPTCPPAPQSPSLMAFGKPAGAGKRFQAFDLLSTLIAVVRTDGSVLFANAGLEDALGTSRRTLEGSQFGACFHEPQVLRTAIDGARSNDFATLRYEAFLRRVNHELMPVQVTLRRATRPAS